MQALDSLKKLMGLFKRLGLAPIYLSLFSLLFVMRIHEL